MSQTKGKKKVRLIDVSGTFFEMGSQYGAACAKEIKQLSETNLKRVGGREALTPVINAAYLPEAESYAPEFVEFIRGVADGAKIDFIDAFFHNTQELMTSPGPFPSLLGGCTSFIASGEATVDGKLIMGWNYDLIERWQEYIVVIKLTPKEGPRVIGPALAGWLPLQGMNSAGLGKVGSRLAYTKDPVHHTPGTPFFIYNQKMIWSENIGQAIDALTRAKRRSDIHAMFGTREGDMLGIEYLSQEFGVLYPQKGMLVHANHFETERFKDGDAVYTFAPDSYVRGARMTRLMEDQHGKLSVDIMKGILADHGNYPESICRHMNPKFYPRRNPNKTLISVIFCPEDQVMYAAYGNPCENEFFKFKL
jgi:isopenicillin-N N-acyltransferase-like protein